MLSLSVQYGLAIDPLQLEVFSKNACTASHNDPPPLLYNLRRDHPLILVRLLTDLPANLIKTIVDGINE